MATVKMMLRHTPALGWCGRLFSPRFLLIVLTATLLVASSLKLVPLLYISYIQAPSNPAGNIANAPELAADHPVPPHLVPAAPSARLAATITALKVSTVPNNATNAAPGSEYVNSVDFEGFNNESGVASLIVPNIVHFLRFDQPEFKFTDVICVLAAVKNHRPDRLYIHTNVKTFTGKYWEFLLNNKEFKNIYAIKMIDLPLYIFGQPFSARWHKQHASDVTRIRILMEYGGIYVDNDTYIVKSLEKFRHFEMTLAWDENQYLGTQTLVAHSKARFLNAWLESYRDNYHAERWYYNAGERPTDTVLKPRPQLVHRVKLLFGAELMLAQKVYKEQWPGWRDNFAVHLLLNFRFQFDAENYRKIPLFDEQNILTYNFTVGEMVRDVLNWNKNNLIEV